jgi:hypothetical protein
VKTDKGYQLLVGAVRKEAEDGAVESELVELKFVPDGGNAVYGLARYDDGHLRLIHGLHTMGPRLKGLAKDGDVGTHIWSTSWSEKLLPHMKMMAGKVNQDLAFCECGHELKAESNAPLPSYGCRGCGYSESKQGGQA